MARTHPRPAESDSSAPPTSESTPDAARHRHRRPADATPVHGWSHPDFAPVRDAFARNLRREVGAALSVTVAGETVVDIWGGEARPGVPWTEDTLCTVFSTTKGLVALAFLRLVDQGRVSLDDRVADHWEGFEEGGKGEITVRQLLEHTAGLPWVEQALTLYDLANPERIDEVLTQERRGLKPGTQAYGATAWGLYAGALYRRITGESVGTALRRDVFGPLDADTWLGLPPEQGDRVAELVGPSGPGVVFTILPDLIFGRGHDARIYRHALRPRTATAKALANPRETGRHGLHNLSDPEVLALELPWCGAVSTARSLCRIYTALANGGRLDGVSVASAQAVQAVTREKKLVRDRVVHKKLAWQRGFLKEEPGTFSRTTAGFGHPGAGGSVGWCDPSDKLAIGYVMNRLDHRLRSPRAHRLCAAVQECLEAGA